MNLRLSNIFGGYQEGQHVLQNLTLELPDNHRLVVLGQNGSGKSTLGKAILNLLPQRKGEIELDGQSIARLRTTQVIQQGVGYFKQRNHVFPNLTVQENLRLANWKKDTQRSGQEWQRLIALIPLLRDKKNYKKKATYLSGGERHQLALAMILMNQPKLLILDEPSAGLSPVHRKKMYELLDNIQAERKISMLLIEQNIHDAVAFSDRVAIMKQGDLILLPKEEKIKIFEKIKLHFIS